MRLLPGGRTDAAHQGGSDPRMERSNGTEHGGGGGMNASKGYSVKILTKEDAATVEELMRKNPLWSKRYARQIAARRKFAEMIKKAGEAKA